MTLEGDLRNSSLGDVLRRVAGERSTGILTIQGEDDIVAVSFLEGEIVSADALNETVEEGLGQILVDDLMQRADFDAAAREHQAGSGGSLGDLLVGKGLLDREQLLQGIRQQIYALLLRVLPWRQGEYKFYGGNEVSFEEDFAPISIEELLVRFRRDLGGPEQEGELPDLDSVYGRVRHEQAPQVLGRDGDGSRGGVWISEDEAAVLRNIDGRRRAHSVGKTLKFGHYKMVYSLHRLRQRGLIEELSSGQEGSSLLGKTLEEELAPLLREPEGLGPDVFRPPDQALAPTDLDFDFGAEEADHAEDPLVAAERLAAVAGMWRGWLAGVMAALLAVAIFALLLEQPSSLLLPFPWQASDRMAHERQQLQTRYAKIDRAASTFFLMDAYFPDSLDNLRALGLLSWSDLRDTSGRPLLYTVEEVAYRLEPLSPVGAPPRQASITDDLHLDPNFLPSTVSSIPPLFLKD